MEATRAAKQKKTKSRVNAEKLAKTLVEQQFGDRQLTNLEKRQAINIVAILLDPGLSVEERIKRIGRAPAFGLFVNAIRNAAIQTAVNKKRVLEKIRAGMKARETKGLLSMTVRDFFDFSVIQKALKTKIEAEINRGAQRNGMEVTGDPKKKKRVRPSNSRQGQHVARLQETRKRKRQITRVNELPRKIVRLGLSALESLNGVIPQTQEHQATAKKRGWTEYLETRGEDRVPETPSLPPVTLYNK